MRFSISNRVLLRGMLASAVVVTGTACSRSDRTESGRDKSAAVLPDTSSTATGAVTDTGVVPDTAKPSAPSSNSAQPGTPAPSNTPRAETAPSAGKDTAGYRPMERDTMNVPGQHSDSARVSADTNVSSVPSDTSMSEMSAGADTTAVGYAEMARDTSTGAEQADTAVTPSGDVALKATAYTSSQANGDVGAEPNVPAADSADTTGNIRPPEDSTEMLGNVTTTDETADETADEQVVRPEDRETVAASETRTDEVGAAAVAGDVTGAEAVALVSRAGVRCAVADPEANESVRWDMSNTPVTLNPCGVGTMIPSRIWTAGQRGSGAAGQ